MDKDDVESMEASEKLDVHRSMVSLCRLMKSRKAIIPSHLYVSPVRMRRDWELVIAFVAPFLHNSIDVRHRSLAFYFEMNLTMMKMKKWVCACNEIVQFHEILLQMDYCRFSIWWFDRSVNEKKMNYFSVVVNFFLCRCWITKVEKLCHLRLFTVEISTKIERAANKD